LEYTLFATSVDAKPINESTDVKEKGKEIVFKNESITGRP
jgi:hypothetical protein